MSKASEIRRQRGDYRPQNRTKPTTGNLGPRDPGPHGKTLEQGHLRWMTDYAQGRIERKSR